MGNFPEILNQHILVGIILVGRLGGLRRTLWNRQGTVQVRRVRIGTSLPFPPPALGRTYLAEMRGPNACEPAPLSCPHL